jgi:lactoylglutathione lyase
MSNDSTNTPNVKLAVPFFMIKDIKASLEYYIKGLGFKMTYDWHDDNGNVKWCWLEIGKASLMLQEYSPAANIPDINLNHSVTIYFICEDALIIYNEALNRGIKAAEPFVGNNMWVVELIDPDGHKIFFESSTDVPEETKYSDWILKKQ